MADQPLKGLRSAEFKRRGMAAVEEVLPAGQGPQFGGGSRPLGIPTVADRLAQMVVWQVLQPQLKRIVDQGLLWRQTGQVGHQAVESCRKRCWKDDWVVALNSKGGFDSIDHAPLLRVRRQ
jgi:retron-type reverse transcriptase